jgi:hypothetical protein
MGEIFLGEHISTGQRVAVKVLHSHLTRDEMFRKRFLAEARAQARLTHPRIAQIISYVEDEGSFFIVMEYLEGESLAARVRRDGPFSPEEGLPIFRQVLEAVEHAHALEVLHRDLKPANVMLMKDGIAKVTDFGTAKVVGAESLTLSGTVVGSPVYMAPEVLQGEDPGLSSEVYSLGVTLYQMLTRKLPYAGNSLADLVRNLRDKDPTPPTQHMPAFPPRLEAIVLKAIAKVKKGRYPTVEALREALDEYRTGERKVERTVVARDRKQSRPQGIPLMQVVLIVMALILLVVLAPFHFPFGILLGAVVLISVGVVTWAQREAQVVRRCRRCRRVMEREWKRCLFCEQGLPRPQLQASLVGKSIDGRPVRWEIPPGVSVVGRREPCQVVIHDDQVSSRHAEIRHQPGQLFIVDLGSTNGTTVNNVTLKADQPTPIYSGDRIFFGQTPLTVEAGPIGEASGDS